MGGDGSRPTTSRCARTLVWVEGNIGCGKSTLLQALSTRGGGIATVPEPVGDWCEHLRGVYGEHGTGTAAPWRLPMAAPTLSTRTETLFSAIRGARAGGCNAAPPSVIVAERSDRSATIFADLTLPNPGDRDAFRTLAMRYALAASGCAERVSMRELTVYLRADPKTCGRRISERARDGESGIGAAYLHALHIAHES